jgi:hypothetical protein
LESSTNQLDVVFGGGIHEFNTWNGPRCILRLDWNAISYGSLHLVWSVLSILQEIKWKKTNDCTKEKKEKTGG